jgi:membrane protein
MGEGMPKDWTMRLKSFATIGLLVAFFAILLVLGPFTVVLAEILKQNFLVDFISDFYPQAQQAIHFTTLILLNVNILTALLSIGFLTLVFHGLFLRRVSYRDSFFGAVVFILLFLSEKYFFWVYLHYARDGLVKSYGDLYTFIAVILWIYFFMCAFFYAAFVTYAGAERRRNVKELPGV